MKIIHSQLQSQLHLHSHSRLQFLLRRSFPVLFLLQTVLFGCFCAEAAECVKVECVDGAPRITVDGEAVRARVFYGGPASRPLQVSAEKPLEVDCDFTPTADSDGRGTFHFRFGKEPGIFRLEEFSIVEKESGTKIAGPYTFDAPEEMKSWCTWGLENDGVTAARVSEVDGALQFEILPGMEHFPLDFHLYHTPNMKLEAGKVYRVRFTLTANTSRDLQTQFYRPGNPFLSLGGVSDSKGETDLFAMQIRLAGESGAQFVSFGIPSIWPNEKGEYDFAALDASIEKVLRSNPNALLIPRIGMNAPSYWLAQHPEDRMVWRGVSQEQLNLKNPMASPSSEAYRLAGQNALRASIRHMEEKFGPHMAGYHPCGQNTGEWFTYDTWLPGRAGFSACDLRAWRKRLREKYNSDAALRSAWKITDVTLETAEVPTFEAYEKSKAEPILTEPTLLDFNAFMQVQMSDTVLAFARAVREATDGKKLVLFFYGYSFEFSCAQNGPAYSAHYALERVLNSPDVDVICSPQSYFDRLAGGGGQCMLPAESVALAGKMYLLEDDTRTHLTPSTQVFPGFRDGGLTCGATRELLRRNTAECACRNFATWWMDLGSAGWFADPKLWEEMKALEEMDRWFLENPTIYAPEVAVFVDENAMQRISCGKYTKRSIYEQRAELSRMGASYGQYFTSDLLSGKMHPSDKNRRFPKLCVMLHAEFYTDAEKAKIQTIVRNEKSTILWVGMEGKTVEELRSAATLAGVHLFTDVPCNVWANGPYVVLHASSDGPVAVTLRNGTPYRLQLKLGETTILKE